MSWTDERVETLKRMWAEGQSASQIAKELGGVTRNAVIGKVHRLGLSHRTPAPAGARPPGREDEGDAALELAEGAELALPAADAASSAEEPPAAEPEAEASEAAVETADRGAAAPAPRWPTVPPGQPVPAQSAPSEVSAETLASAREVEKRARRLTLMELTERTCRWPVGDPATPDFWFCGLPVEPGKPYCEAHVQVAFQPMSARRDRRR